MVLYTLCMGGALSTLSLDTQFFRDVFNASPIGIAVETLDGQPFYVNPALCCFLGFTEEELGSKHCVDFSPKEDAERDWALFQQLKAGSIGHYQLEKRYFRKDGSMVWGRLSVSLSSGHPSPLVIAMVEDITDKKKSEQALFRHAAIVESCDEGISSVTLDGITETWNAGAQRMFGYTENETVGKPASIIVPPELRDQQKTILETLRAGGRIEQFETIRVSKTGRRIDVSLSISPIKDSNGKIVGCAAIARDISQRKLAEQAIADISRKLVVIQEEERARIARDLHDDINQRLALLAVEMEGLKENLPSSSSVLGHRLSDFKEQIAEASKSVQTISHQLHSPQLEYLGVVAAMKSFCREFSARRAVEVDFKNDDIPQPVSYEISLCLFRILQEALHNAAKHSNVRHFDVKLGYDENQLELTVSDRGAGFDAESALDRGGLGLISMRERVRLVNGTITIDSKPMGGTAIRVRVPLALEHKEQRAAG